MSLSNDFHMDIKTIHIAHEYVLDRVHKCEYPRGRGTYGLIYALGGRAEYRFFAGERLTIHEGDVLFVSPHTAYSIVTEKEFKHYTVNFVIHEESSKNDIAFFVRTVEVAKWRERHELHHGGGVRTRAWPNCSRPSIPTI